MTKKTGKRKRQQRRTAVPRQRSSFLPLALIGGILILVAAGLLLLLRQPAADQAQVPVTVSGSPNLEIDREQIDFGDVTVNRMIRANFKLSNTGDQPLVLTHSPVAKVAEGC